MTVTYDELALLTAVKAAVQAVSGFGTGSVVISSVNAEQVMQSARLPLAVIRSLSATADLDEPGLWTVDVGVSIACLDAGDATGENAHIGSHGYAGLFEIQRLVLLAIQKLGRDSGVPIQFVGAGAAQTEQWETGRYVVWRELRFRARVAFETEPPTGGAPDQTRWNPGRLVLAPTQNPSGNTYPFGGTEIGIVRAMRFRKSYQLAVEVAEEFEQAETEHGFTARKCRLVCNLRGWNKTAIGSLPGGSIIASTTGKIAVALNANAGGAKLTGFKLLVVPDAVALGQVTVAACTDIATALYDAAYLPEESSEAQLSYGTEYGLPVVFVGRPDANGNLYQETTLANITGFA